MKKYCLDTSGLSTALEQMPSDIHVTLWERITAAIAAGQFAVTVEIYDELTHVTGIVGDCIRSNQLAMILEVGQASWNYAAYISHNSRMLKDHELFIAELGAGGSRKTVGVNDITIVALGKALNLPVISAEKPCSRDSRTKRKIPDVCSIEGVRHLDFNDFLRAESIKT